MVGEEGYEVLRWGYFWGKGDGKGDRKEDGGREMGKGRGREEGRRREGGDGSSGGVFLLLDTRIVKSIQNASPSKCQNPSKFQSSS